MLASHRLHLYLSCALACAACGQAKPQRAAHSASGDLHARDGASSAQPVSERADAPMATDAAVPATCSDAAVRSPLERAAFEGDIQNARMLVVAAEQEPARTPCGPTALMLALMPYPEAPGTPSRDARNRRFDKLDAAGLFLTRCFNVTATDERGLGALHVAVTAPDPERIVTRLMKRMLECGVQPDAKTDQGITPLMLAVEAKRTNIVRFLLEEGADPNLGAASGETPLTLAEKARNRELVATLHKTKPRDAGL
jgi:hypothetical protein